MKVLVSAFKSFNKASNNYSLEVLNYISGVDKVILDVLYDKSYYNLSECNLNNYDLIICLGEARSREELTLELYAKNISSCSICDNAGVFKNDEKILLDGLDLLKTKVDVDKVSDIVKFSSDAGKYVCNNLYYHLLSDYPEKGIFIHVPNCYDETINYVKYAEVIMMIIKELTLC